MDYLEQPSIDSMIAVSQLDLDRVRSEMNAYFQQRGSRRNRVHFAPSPSSPCRYDALGSHPTKNRRKEERFNDHSKSRIQTTRLIIPESTSSSDFASSYTSFDDYLSESALYTPTDLIHVPSPLSSLSSLSASSTLTPITPPTPRSPLLPEFPDLGLTVSIYRDIPFSPIEPGFTDCPFQYYNDDIPPSKSRRIIQLPTESFFVAPISPVAPIPRSPISKTIALLQAMDVEEHNQPQLQHGAEFDFDTDDSDTDDWFDQDDGVYGHDDADVQCNDDMEITSAQLTRTASHTIEAQSEPNLTNVSLDDDIMAIRVSDIESAATRVNQRRLFDNMTLTEQLNELERLYANLKNTRAQAKGACMQTDGSNDNQRKNHACTSQNHHESGWSYI